MYTHAPAHTVARRIARRGTIVDQLSWPQSGAFRKGGAA